MDTNTNHGKIAFTLVELLVVIALVSLIVALVMPAFIAARGTPRSTACVSNLKQLYAACSLYASDNNGYLPPYQNQIGIRVFAGQGRPYYDVPENGKELTSVLAPYVKSPEIWFCPVDYLARTNSTEGELRHQFASYKIDFYPGAYEVRGVVMLEGGVSSVDGSEDTSRPFLKDSLWESARSYPEPLYSHNGSFNFTFFDGHVKSYPWKGSPW